MLNIGRMGRGSADYYLDAVAQVRVDYYHGHGEAPGRWLGSGLDGLELEIGLEVTRQALGRVLDGDHPGSGERVAAHPAESSGLSGVSADDATRRPWTRTEMRAPPTAYRASPTRRDEQRPARPFS